MTVRSLFIVVMILTASASLAQVEADSTSVINPEAAQASVASARQAASKDRHEEAAGEFIEALNHDARLVSVVVDELAYQKLWREDAEKAIFYFRRYLARHPDKANREARKGLATALSWSGRQGEAVALYRELLAEDPTDKGVQLGLGRSLIWDNRLAEGYDVLREIETEVPDTERVHRETGRFLLTVLDEYDPHLDVRFDAIHDSDDLDIKRLDGRGRTNVGSVLLEGGLAYAWYRQPNQPNLSAPRFRFGAVAPLHHRWTLHAYGWVEKFSSHGEESTFGEIDWTRLGGDAWLTFIATPRLRLDLGGSSQHLDTYQALASKIHYETGSLSADYRFHRNWMLSAAGQLSDFSDGNARRRGFGALKWRREGTWSINLGPTFLYMDHDLAYPGGYWSPKWVRNGSIALGLKRSWDRWVLHLDGSIGQEQELGSDSLTVGGAAGRLGYRVSPGWLIHAGGGYSRSRFSSASGYSRTAINVGARALF